MVGPSRGIAYLDLANSRSERAEEKMIAGHCGSHIDRVLRQLTRMTNGAQALAS